MQSAQDHGDDGAVHRRDTAGPRGAPGGCERGRPGGPVERLIALARAALVAHQEALHARAVVEGAHDAFVSLDTAGVVTTWNAAAERLFGWSAAEAVGRPLTELIIPSRFRRAHREGLARAGDRRTPSARRLEVSAVHRDGREFPVDLAIQTTIEYGAPAFHAFLHDITDRYADRSRLEQEQTFLRTLLDSLGVGVLACDADGRVAVFNQALRHSRPHVPDLHVRDLAAVYRLHTADGRTPLAADRLPLARALAGEHVDGEHVVAHMPGRLPRRFSVTARPIDTADGRRLGAVAVLDDITDRHKAEVLRTVQHAVSEILAQASSVEEAASDVVAAIAEGLDWCGGEYWQVTSDRSAIVRAGLWTVPGRDLTAFLQGRPTRLLPGQGFCGMVWAGGDTMWITDLAGDPRDFSRKEQALQAGLRAGVGLPVRSGRHILGVLLLVTDTVQQPDRDLIALLDGVCAHISRCTERQRAEELSAALTVSRRQFEQVVAHINDNVWTAEITPEGETRSVYQSQNATALFGRAISDDIDLADLIARHVHPDDRTAYDAFVARLRAAQPAEIECRVVGVDDRTRWIWIRALPRREGRRLFIDGISSDVTERRRLATERERLLLQEQRQVKRLRQLDAMKDELMAVVTHELRNPIGAIRGYAELLADDPDLTDAQRTFTDVIDRKSAHLQSLVDDLLDLARLDAGHVTVERRPIDLDQVVRQAVDEHRPAADAKRLALVADLPVRLPMHADALRMRQVLDNLLSNALKYTPDGGTVTVAARRDSGDRPAAAHPADPTADPTAEHGAAHPAEHGADHGTDHGAEHGAVVTVADTGIGIPAEEYGQLFSRFFRASTAQDAGIKGTGLGLAIARAIVEAHDGTLTAAARAGGGTVFTVRLPAGPPPLRDGGRGGRGL
ncbi:PAS domain S-box protein [Planomonospora sp. ID82291]|uniref:PAS domain-containing sensor histidine kinase n=1 Tax=Planomonospora sp. ID82291 TaxID=2738136 RepID=UPI0018C3D738|nr:PAS domain S-box protein [Planomonospora sp. ID82291]MBG0813380.1 PAS domain S-box protein [Planomonospora sp. ID82291]